MNIQTKHVEDGKTNVIAKGNIVNGEFVGEYKFKGMTYGITIPYPSFEKWSAEIADMMKKYPLVHNRWKTEKFRKMYNKGLSVNEAFRCWFCAH